MNTILKTLSPSIADLLEPSVGKVIEFLIENRSFDYSKEEIAQESGISRPTLYRIWPLLEKNCLLIETRKYGNTQLYKLNEENMLVKALIELEVSMVREQFRRMEKL